MRAFGDDSRGVPFADAFKWPRATDTRRTQAPAIVTATYCPLLHSSSSWYSGAASSGSYPACAVEDPGVARVANPPLELKLEVAEDLSS